MALMTIGMAIFAGVDGFIKLISASILPTHIIAVAGLGGLFLFWIAARFARQSLVSPAIFAPAVIVRNIGECMSAFGMVLALSVVPISLVTTIVQTVPLFVTIGAALLLGERAGIKIWLAILVGFLGMLIIMRPTPGDFDATILFALAGAIGLAARDLASRVVAGRATSLQLSAWGCGSLALSGIVLAVLQGQFAFSPTLFEWLILLLIITFAGVGLLCITAAMRIGDVGTISPFRYTRLVFGLLVGILFFGETLDLYALIGGSIIVLCGLYVWWSQSR